MPTKKGTWGGRREGAGRPNLTGLRAHVKRPRVHAKARLKVSFDAADHVPDLRSPKLRKLLKDAWSNTDRYGLHVERASLQAKRVTLFLRAPNNKELERGLKSFAIRAALAIRKLLHSRSARTKPRAPSFFKGRYELEILRGD